MDDVSRAGNDQRAYFQGGFFLRGARGSEPPAFYALSCTTESVAGAARSRSPWDGRNPRRCEHILEPAHFRCQAFYKCIEAGPKRAANAEVVSTVIDAPKRTAQTVKVPGCFVRIQGSYVSLRAAEQRVADFILKNAEELIYLTVTELAERTQTSESTVVRLCQKIGYKGYQEFKIVLARDLVEPTDAIYERIEESDASSAIKTKVFAANAQALQDTLEVLDDLELAARDRCGGERQTRRDLWRRRQRIDRARRIPQAAQARHRRNRASPIRT